MMNKTYWNAQGTYQDLIDELQDAVGPDSHPLPKKSALERFHKASICYYDLYNNGLYNRALLAAKVFGFKVSDYRNRALVSALRPEYYEKVEAVMDKIIEDAYSELNRASV
jgi:hypothetical protein